MSYQKWFLETAYAVARSSILDSHSKYAHRWPIRALEHHPKTVEVKRNLWTDINGCWMKYPAKIVRGKVNLPRPQILPSRAKNINKNFTVWSHVNEIKVHLESVLN